MSFTLISVFSALMEPGLAWPVSHSFAAFPGFFVAWVADSSLVCRVDSDWDGRGDYLVC